MKFNIFTTCTASGTVPAVEILDGANWMEQSTHQEFRDAWCKEESELGEDDKIVVSQLYSGTSFQTVHSVREEIIERKHQVDVKIVSLGYGLLDWSDSIHPYNLSMNMGSKASMYRIVAGEKFSPERWWSLINSGMGKSRTPITDYLKSKGEKGSINIVCVSTSFLQLIGDDLLEASRVEGLDFVVVGPTNTSQMIKAPRLLARGGFIQTFKRDAIRTGASQNKYNFPQRCAHQIVQDMLDDPKLSLREVTDKYVGISNTNRTTGPELSEFIEKAQKDKLTLDAAFNRYIEAGGRVSFIGFKQVFAPETPVRDDRLMEIATSMLSKIGLAEDTTEREEEAMRVLTTFRDALEATNKRGATFTASDITSWAKMTYDAFGEELSELVLEPRKLTHFIKSVGPALGFTEETSPNQVKRFRYVGLPNDQK